MPKVPRSNRTLNRLVSSHIPPSNDSFCICIRDFSKMIMGLTKNNKNLPLPSSSDEVERANLLNITDVDINSLIIDESNISVDEASITKEISTKFKILCLSELAKNNINLATFQWDVKGQTKWDGLVINVVVKHWLHAKNNQAFEEYPLQQEYCTNTICLSWLGPPNYQIEKLISLRSPQCNKIYASGILPDSAPKQNPQETYSGPRAQILSRLDPPKSPTTTASRTLKAKKWEISDENGSTVFTTNSGTQTSGERHCEFDYFKNKNNKMNEKVKLISHQMWGLKKNINKGGMVKKRIFKTATTAPKEI
ncbi:hypothetical protein PPACK8108_LOCUS23161 [Phakopsora pachyrhizi]|uniref:Uncharacterized protein n=1 Tax=Phakopsora pachyrhizi TaxID=170000 RepID=A0AAV0BPT0_PHAPC|nr:hypothetical protein PPACK8108_LOCUS23161 [Phakopsora pachyrhizi]